MRRVPLTLCAGAVALIGGCASYEPVTPAGSVVTAPNATVTTPAPGVVAAPPVAVQSGTTVVTPGTVVAPGTAVVVPPAAGVRPGTGRIDSSTRLSQASGLSNPMRRYGIRMDDGTVQFVDSQAPNLEIGDRVELTADNHIRYPVLR